MFNTVKGKKKYADVATCWRLKFFWSVAKVGLRNKSLTFIYLLFCLLNSLDKSVLLSDLVKSSENLFPIFQKFNSGPDFRQSFFLTLGFFEVVTDTINTGPLAMTTWLHLRAT